MRPQNERDQMVNQILYRCLWTPLSLIRGAHTSKDSGEISRNPSSSHSNIYVHSLSLFMAPWLFLISTARQQVIHTDNKGLKLRRHCLDSWQLSTLPCTSQNAFFKFVTCLTGGKLCLSSSFLRTIIFWLELSAGTFRGDKLKTDCDESQFEFSRPKFCPRDWFLNGPAARSLAGVKWNETIGIYSLD